MVTYSSNYVNSSGVLLPTGGAADRILANGQTLVVELDNCNSVVTPSSSVLATPVG